MGQMHDTKQRLIPIALIYWSTFWSGKMVNDKALIAVCSCSTYKINNAVSDHFNQQNRPVNYGDWYYNQLWYL